MCQALCWTSTDTSRNLLSRRAKTASHGTHVSAVRKLQSLKLPERSLGVQPVQYFIHITSFNPHSNAVGCILYLNRPHEETEND